MFVNTHMRTNRRWVRFTNGDRGVAFNFLACSLYDFKSGYIDFNILGF